MSRFKYRRVAIGNIEDDANRSHFAWIREWSQTRQKHLKKHNISNPYGRVSMKRRMSISCPSTPVSVHSQITTQLLAEASEKLLGSSETSDDEQRGVEEGRLFLLSFLPEPKIPFKFSYWQNSVCKCMLTLLSIHRVD